jgi:hypothetical protein
VNIEYQQTVEFWIDDGYGGIESSEREDQRAAVACCHLDHLATNEGWVLAEV